MDPGGDILVIKTSKSVELLKYVTKERLEKCRIFWTIGLTTYMVFENPVNPNNAWAALRTFDTFGLQYVDMITDKESYHSKTRRKSMFEALGAQVDVLKQHMTTPNVCLTSKIKATALL